MRHGYVTLAELTNSDLDRAAELVEQRTDFPLGATDASPANIGLRDPATNLREIRLIPLRLHRCGVSVIAEYQRDVDAQPARRLHKRRNQ